jgi:Protein of unknown function (DUF1569)
MHSSTDLERRAVMLAAAGSAAFGLAACSETPAMKLESFVQAMTFVEHLKKEKVTLPGDWSAAQVLEHAAQSIEYSLTGYPQAKSRLFQSTAGAGAFAYFKAKGAMSHALTEAIPGAPALVSSDVAQAADRLQKSIDAFNAHTGGLKPHFAYGKLDKAEYTQAHLMHLANHFGVMRFA